MSTRQSECSSHEQGPSFSAPSGTKTMSFAEIVRGREASVRMTDDYLLYAVDLVMVVTGKDRDYSGQVIAFITCPIRFAIWYFS